MLEVLSIPQLRSPILIAAFEGWNDAGESASGVIDHLLDQWQAEEIAYFDPENYYDFQVNRPTVRLSELGTREIEWPTTSFYSITLPHASRDIVLVRGIEPSMRWRSYVEEFLGYCDDLEIELIVTLGALLSETPHTRPLHVIGSGSDAEVVNRYSLNVSSYEGPTGIVGALQEACSRLEKKALSLWVQVPHYVSQPPCPKGSLALISRLEDLLSIDLPLGDLEEESKAWETGVNQLASEDAEVASYVSNLEEQQDATDLPEASGDAIAREFERYLRHRDPGA